MGYKLIQLPEHDIIASDAKPAKGDYIIEHPRAGGRILKVKDTDNRNVYFENALSIEYKWVNKVIAGLPTLPTIDYNGFYEAIGLIDIEGLACEYEKENGGAFSVGIKDAFIEGARIGKSLDDKKFTKEDIMAWYKYVKTHTCEEAFEHLKKIKQQPKTFDIEVEEYQEYVRPNEHEIRNLIKHKYSTFVKITNNTIKITKIL